MSNATAPSPTFLLVQAAGAARDHWMKEAHRLEGTPGEAAADAAYNAAEAALEAASKAHRAARRANGDNVPAERSWINAGDRAPVLYKALELLQVPGVRVHSDGLVEVTVPDGTNPDVHQDALTAIANTVIA